MCVSSFFPPLLPETSSKLEKMTSLVQGPKASRVFCLPYESAAEVWRHRASNLDIRPPNLRQGGRLPWWLSAKEFACQHRRHGFDSCSRKIPHAKEQLSLCTTTTEPTCYRYWSPRARALQQEKPLEWEARVLQLESSPHSLQWEKNPPSKEDPAQPKIHR